MATKWNPEKYSQASQTQNRHASDLLKKVDFNGVGKVLDIGSGNGLITCQIAEQHKHAHVLGIDSSAEMTLYAQRTYQKNNLLFQQLSAENMDFNNHFDLAVSFSTMHWIKDQQSVFKQTYRALKPNGIFIGFLYPRCAIQCDSLKQTTQSPKYKPYFPRFFEPFYGYDDKYYQTLVKALGFHVNRIELTPTEYITYESKSSLADFLGGWLPHAKCLPDGIRDKFLQDFVDIYCNNINQIIKQDDAVVVPFRKIELELLKAK